MKLLKFGFIIFCLLFFGFGLIKPAEAQSTLNYPPQTNPDVPKNLHTYTQSTIIELLAAASCQLLGIDPLNIGGKCLGIDLKTKKIGYVENNGGVMAFAGDMIGDTFKIPISSHQYFASLASQFGLAKKTYAKEIDVFDVESGSTTAQNTGGLGQGLGFLGLHPLIKLWTEFRNIVYLIFVFIFVLIGLGVMFRLKIDPRTVMTIQNQLPKIVIALILVAFSYAIAGFLVDLMYVLLYLVFQIFGNIDPSIKAVNPSTFIYTSPVGAVGGIGGLAGIANNAGGSVGNIIASLFDGTWGRVVAGIISSVLGGIVGGGIGTIFGGAGGAIGAAVGGVVTGLVGSIFFSNSVLSITAHVIGFLIIGIAMLQALFRLWFQLIKAYIYILIGVTLAPFYIVMGLFPGSGVGFGSWLRTLISNLAAFPTVLFMFLLGEFFIRGFKTNGANNFVPPFVGNPSNMSNFGALIGLGIILMTPEVVNIVRDKLKAPQFKYTSAISKGIGTGAGITASPFTTTWNRLKRVDSAGQPIGSVADWAHKGTGRIHAIARLALGVKK